MRALMIFSDMLVSCRTVSNDTIAFEARDRNAKLEYIENGEERTAYRETAKFWLFGLKDVFVQDNIDHSSDLLRSIFSLWHESYHQAEKLFNSDGNIYKSIANYGFQIGQHIELERQEHSIYDAHAEICGRSFRLNDTDKADHFGLLRELIFQNDLQSYRISIGLPPVPLPTQSPQWQTLTG